jgi:acetylornithine deacetylase/succinyl-diaminopimelate desuccinylase-like protein
MMQGSDQLNVLPRSPHIDLDCRVLPGTTPSDLTQMLKRIINDDDVQIYAHREVQGLAGEELSMPVTPAHGPQWNFVKNAIG